MAAMLLQIGPLQFTIDPFNAHEISRAAKTEFAKKDVINRSKIYEHTGEGDDSYVVRGRLFPYKMGGLGVLALAHTIREQGQAQMMVRGDGNVLGWFVITEITELSSHLGGDGVGQLIDIEISLERADKPSAQQYFSNLYGLSQ